MATRTDPIAHDFGMEFEVPVPPKTTGRAVVLPEIGLTLRKLNPGETNYDPSGRYLETRVALPNWKPGGIEALFGFESCEGIDPPIRNQVDTDKATVTYQVSNDDGVTWLTYDAGLGSWEPATGVLDDVFVSGEVLDERLPLIPFADDRQLRLRAKLTPGASGRQRPVLQWTTFYHDVNLDLYEDISRSIKRYIDKAIQVPMFFIAALSGTASVIIPDSSSDPNIQPSEPGFDVEVVEPVQAFNLDTDPGRLVDLFGSLGGPKGRTITLIGPQSGTVEIQFTGLPDVFIGAEEFFQLSKIPSVVVVVDRVEDYDLIRTYQAETEKSKARCVGRRQPARVPYNIYVSVRVQSSLKREALQMTDAIARILDKGDVFPSVALGDDYCVLEQTNQVEEDQVAQGLFVGNITLRIMGKTWLKDPTADIPLVKQVRMLTGAQFTCNLKLPPHLRNVYREETSVNGP